MASWETLDDFLACVDAIPLDKTGLALAEVLTSIVLSLVSTFLTREGLVW